jgi:hypothetical protein
MLWSRRVVLFGLGLLIIPPDGSTAHLAGSPITPAFTVQYSEQALLQHSVLIGGPILSPRWRIRGVRWLLPVLLSIGVFNGQTLPFAPRESRLPTKDKTVVFHTDGDNEPRMFSFQDDWGVLPKDIWPARAPDERELEKEVRRTLQRYIFGTQPIYVFFAEIPLVTTDGPVAAEVHPLKVRTSRETVEMAVGLVFNRNYWRPLMTQGRATLDRRRYSIYHELYHAAGVPSLPEVLSARILELLRLGGPARHSLEIAANIKPDAYEALRAQEEIGAILFGLKHATVDGLDRERLIQLLFRERSTFDHRVKKIAKKLGLDKKGTRLVRDILEQSVTRTIVDTKNPAPAVPVKLGIRGAA